ncbi:MAG TPA: SIS domain-containing protein, partial [Nitriliruptorales bacterium]
MTPRTSTVDLDALDLGRVDPAGMLATVEASGDQWDAALAIARGVRDPRHGRIRSVVVCGMGGSGIAADVARAVAFHHGTGVPVIPAKGYTLPAWIGPQTLVVGVSFSGGTEETRACLEQARQARAQIAVVTSGGHIGAVAGERGWATVEIPGGGQPRANLAYLSVPVLGLLEAAGVVKGALDTLGGVGDHVRAAADAWRHDVPSDDNAVKQAALALDGLVPVFYGGAGLPALVAQRAKC